MFKHHKTGISSHLAVAKRLVDLGYEVLQPIDDDAPYDLAYITWTTNGWFRSEHPVICRIQCKTARYMDEGRNGKAGGYLEFRGYRANSVSRRKGYWGEAEYFGVYSPDLDKVYLVPVMAFPDGSEIRLRIHKSKNNQEANIHWAKDYEL